MLECNCICKKVHYNELSIKKEWQFKKGKETRESSWIYANFVQQPVLAWTNVPRSVNTVEQV